MTLERGSLLNNRYQILDILGQGGMGSVYRALDMNLGINVAVKENLYLADEFARQFRREANILASLRHPNLPRVADHFEIPNQGQYLIMDYIEGEDLRQRLERLGPLPDDEVIMIGVAICDALSYLHTRKPPIIHRDIKPGNVKINPEGQIILVDFGLAKLMHESQATTTGARAMTPGYSPPEQYGTGRTDARTDIYSLSATLYAASTGVIPEDGLARATGTAQLTPLRKIIPQINRKLALAIEHGLSIPADERYQTAEEYKSTLMDALVNSRRPRDGITITPPPPSTPSIDLIFQENGASSSPLSLAKLPTHTEFIHERPWQKGSNWLALGLLILLFITGVFFALNPPVHWGALVANLRATPTISPTDTPTLLVTDFPSIVCPSGDCTTLTPGAIETRAALAAPTETPTVIITPTATALGGGVGEIAFVSDRTGTDQIWIMDASGGSLQQVTNMPDGACQPSWSPDGQALVFISPCSGKAEIYQRTSMYTIHRDGTNLVSLPTSPEGDFDPAWSPDGGRIAFTSLRNNQTHIFILNLADNTTLQITSEPFQDLQPSWSPSGAQLVFIRYRSSSEVRIISDNGENEIKFSTSGTINDYWPIWSPDSQVIYFGQIQAGGSLPWLMGMRYEDRDTTKEFKITVVNQDNFGPIAQAKLSPDGNWFAYEGWPEGHNHDIYRMTINGANVLRLTTDPANDYQPVWNPAK